MIALRVTALEVGELRQRRCKAEAVARQPPTVPQVQLPQRRQPRQPRLQQDAYMVLGCSPEPLMN